MCNSAKKLKHVNRERGSARVKCLCNLEKEKNQERNYISEKTAGCEDTSGPYVSAKTRAALVLGGGAPRCPYDCYDASEAERGGAATGGRCSPRGGGVVSKVRP